MWGPQAEAMLCVGLMGSLMVGRAEAFTAHSGQSGEPQSGQLMPALQEGRFGYVDAGGRFVIPPRFNAARNFFEGLAAVEQDGKWGYIDPRGAFVIEPRFEWAFDCRSGIVQAGEGLTKQYWNPLGQLVAP